MDIIKNTSKFTFRQVFAKVYQKCALCRKSLFSQSVISNVALTSQWECQNVYLGIYTNMCVFLCVFAIDHIKMWMKEKNSSIRPGWVLVFTHLWPQPVLETCLTGPGKMCHYIKDFIILYVDMQRVFV